MKRCPYCAEEIQDEAIFCKHCKRDLVDRPVEYEYTDFVYEWSAERKNWTYVRKSDDQEITIRLRAWQEEQRYISVELERMFDQGWEAVGEIGSGNIILEWENAGDSFNHWMSGVPKSESGPRGCGATPRALGMFLLFCILIMATFGLVFIPIFIVYGTYRYGAPKQYQMQLRRQKAKE